MEEETLEVERKCEDKIFRYIHYIMEKYCIGPASMKAILETIARNINPYISGEELLNIDSKLFFNEERWLQVQKNHV